MRAIARPAAALSTLLLSGCTGWQSALDPHGPGARSIAWLFWVFTALSVVVWTLVMIALAAAVIWRRFRPVDPFARFDPLRPDPATDKRATRIIVGAVGATVLILLVLTGSSYVTQKVLAEPKPDELSIHVTGQQWWWNVRYEDAEPSRVFNTANEIHIPVGRPVRLTLESADVIHSFWVPSLTGKMDLIPGRQNELRLAADRAGMYRGQCAEFCGYQHAHMGMLVVAEPEAEFEAWRNGQIAAAATPPPGSLGEQGAGVFNSQACVMCHSIRGQPAGGRTGPDLTHIGSRQTVAAGTLPMSRGSLAAWIIDPQRIKPGAKMPTIKLNPDQVNALAAYLEGLK
jgi:cytochrome c oxidase subunit 2